VTLSGQPTCFDPLSQLDLFLGAERHHVVTLRKELAHPVGRCGELGLHEGLPQNLGFPFVPNEVARSPVFLARLAEFAIIMA
jgi:hypothetical protein